MDWWAAEAACTPGVPALAAVGAFAGAFARGNAAADIAGADGTAAVLVAFPDDAAAENCCLAHAQMAGEVETVVAVGSGAGVSGADGTAAVEVAACCRGDAAAALRSAGGAGSPDSVAAVAAGVLVVFGACLELADWAEDLWTADAACVDAADAARSCWPVVDSTAEAEAEAEAAAEAAAEQVAGAVQTGGRKRGCSRGTH